MAGNNNDKKKIWIYAVILFTSAFIVLLLTAISQIKLNNNINNYKTQIYTNEKEKSDFQLNLSSSKNENKKLQDELNTIKEQLDKEIKLNEDEKKRYSELEEKVADTIRSYDMLIQAENEYTKKDYIASALILYKQCDIKYLSAKAKEEYTFLKENTYKKASKILYLNGLKKYKNGSYTAAIDDLQLSVDLAPSEYYSDDCYYYIAYSQYKSGKIDLAANTINMLIKKYPSSSYINDVLDLFKLLKK